MTKNMQAREVVARALCRQAGNPENTAFEGSPMWESYLSEADAVVAAILQAQSAGQLTLIPSEPTGAVALQMMQFDDGIGFAFLGEEGSTIAVSLPAHPSHSATAISSIMEAIESAVQRLFAGPQA